jgi:hypothetical protein
MNTPTNSKRSSDREGGLTLELSSIEPARSSFRGARAVPAAFVMGLLLWGTVGTPNNGIREDETQCEEVVAHLAECCPGLDPKRYRCEHVVADGCTGGTEPDFGIELSKTLRKLDCDDLVAGNWCNYTPPSMTSDSTGGGL